MVWWILSFSGRIWRGLCRGPTAPAAAVLLSTSADVPGADPAGQPQPVGRAGRVSDQGPAFVHALSRARVGESGAGCEHDLDVPRGADACHADGPAGDRGAVRGLRGSADSGKLPGDGWPDRRRLHHRRPEAAQHGCREARHQGGAHPGQVGGQGAKLAQKDRDARWTVKWSKAKPAEDGPPRMDLAVPAFGYKNHVGIDRHHGLIRTWSVTDAARHDGSQLPTLISKANTGSDVWGDTAYVHVRTRGSWLRTADAHRSTARSRRASRCPSTRPGERGQVKGASRRRARVRTREGADWAWSCARSVWPERG